MSRGGSLPPDIQHGSVLSTLPSPLPYTMSGGPKLGSAGSIAAQEAAGAAALVKQQWMMGSNKISPAGLGPSLGASSHEGGTKGVSGQGYDVGVATPTVHEAALSNAAGHPLLGNDHLADTPAAALSTGGEDGLVSHSSSHTTQGAANTEYRISAGLAHTGAPDISAEAVQSGTHLYIPPAVLAGVQQPGPVAESTAGFPQATAQLAGAALGSGRASADHLPQDGIRKHGSVAFSVDALVDSQQVRPVSTPSPSPNQLCRAVPRAAVGQLAFAAMQSHP